jgi:hypothetical protein
MKNYIPSKQKEFFQNITKIYYSQIDFKPKSVRLTGIPQLSFKENILTDWDIVQNIKRKYPNMNYYPNLNFYNIRIGLDLINQRKLSAFEFNKILNISQSEKQNLLNNNTIIDVRNSRFLIKEEFLGQQMEIDRYNNSLINIDTLLTKYYRYRITSIKNDFLEIINKKRISNLIDVISRSIKRYFIKNFNHHINNAKQIVESLKNKNKILDNRQELNSPMETIRNKSVDENHKNDDVERIKADNKKSISRVSEITQMTTLFRIRPKEKYIKMVYFEPNLSHKNMNEFLNTMNDYMNSDFCTLFTLLYYLPVDKYDENLALTITKCYHPSLETAETELYLKYLKLLKTELFRYNTNWSQKEINSYKPVNLLNVLEYHAIRKMYPNLVFNHNDKLYCYCNKGVISDLTFIIYAEHIEIWSGQDVFNSPISDVDFDFYQIQLCFKNSPFDPGIKYGTYSNPYFSD